MNEPIKYQSVTNMTDEDLNFTYNSAPYVLKAGETEERWQPYLAKHAAKKLADKNVKTNNPDEHRVFMGAYLNGSAPKVIAERLKINIDKIREEALTKEKEAKKVSNLESLVLEMKKEMEEMKTKKLDVKEEVKEPKEEIKKDITKEVKKVVTKEK